MDNLDYSPFQVSASQKMKEAHEQLLKNNRQQAVEKVEEAIANLRLMKTAIKYSA